MLTRGELKKNVRFHDISETFTYTFPCHVCHFETGRKKELEYHLLYEHSIRQSFTHSLTRKQRLEEQPLSLPSVLLLGLGTILYLLSYAWILLALANIGQSNTASVLSTPE